MIVDILEFDFSQSYVNMAHFTDPAIVQMVRVIQEWHFKVYGFIGVCYTTADVNDYIIMCGEAIVFSGTFIEFFLYYMEISNAL